MDCWVVMAYHCRFIVITNVPLCCGYINVAGFAYVRAGVYESPLYSPLHFDVNLKLCKKKNIFSKTSVCSMKLLLYTFQKIGKAIIRDEPIIQKLVFVFIPNWVVLMFREN